MTWRVVAIAGKGDAYDDVGQSNGDRLLRVPFNVPGDPDRLQSSIVDELAQFELVLAPSAEDFLNFAIAAYTADIRIPRHSAFDSWTRDIELQIFVYDLNTWQRCRRIAEDLLSFITGDHWTLSVRARPHSYQPEQGHKPPSHSKLATEIAVLFSGGLDSFIGAINALETYGDVALVGHHGAGAGATSRSQTDALNAIRKAYPAERCPFLQFWLSPPKGLSRESETTTRGRSILFFGLGVAVAEASKAKRLVVPENGVISLNVPLSPSRLGSFSTRTTHPHTIELLRRLLSAIGINMAIDLPYRFSTKGEMLQGCKNQEALRAGVGVTMSCSHPAAGRFTGSSNRHCGRCIPCVIRRAAIHAAGSGDPTEYIVKNILRPIEGETGSDLRVVRLALDRFNGRPPAIVDVLKSGPLPGADAELQGYVDVFDRGLAELRQLLT